MTCNLADRREIIPDVPLFVVFSQTFLLLNAHGWGFWHEQRFFFLVIVLSFLYILTAFGLTRISPLYGRRIKVLLIGIYIVFTLFFSVWSFMKLRFMTAPEGFLSDSGVAVEVTGRALLSGNNPYAVTYEDTELARVPYVDAEGSTENPALYHNAYPPFLPILSAVSQAVLRPLTGYFDIRIVYLAFYILLLASGFAMLGMTDAFVLYLILVCMNPMFLTSLGQGGNDVVILAMVFASSLLLTRKRIVASGIVYGIAIGTKQLAWVAYPLFLAYAWIVGGRARMLRFLVASSVFAIVIIGPFLLIDPAAFIEDTVFYMSGSLPTSYPIHNFGLGMLLVTEGLIRSIYSYYPFWIWQAVILVPVFSLWFAFARKRPTLSVLLYGTGGMLAVVWIFNRFMNFSYLAVLQIFASLAYVAGRVEGREKRPG